MVTLHIISKIGQNNQLSTFGVSAIEKGGGAAPKCHSIGLKFLWGSFLVMWSQNRWRKTNFQNFFFWDTLPAWLEDQKVLSLSPGQGHLVNKMYLELQ